jgi:hypothetical protein
MRENTITKYKNVIDIAMHQSFRVGFITRSDFDVLAEKHKMTHTIATYLQRMNIIQRIDANRFKFVRPVTVVDIKEMGAMQMSANIRNRQKRSQNTKQMTIETSVPKVNVITTDSDEFARQAMAYLESRGFKVTKEKLTLPIATYRGTITSAMTPNLQHLIEKVGHMETKHIMMAYDAGRSCKYNTPEEYMKNEYNDFAS